jgi:hypothetical protein
MCFFSAFLSLPFRPLDFWNFHDIIHKMQTNVSNNNLSLRSLCELCASVYPKRSQGAIAVFGLDKTRHFPTYFIFFTEQTQHSSHFCLKAANSPISLGDLKGVCYLLLFI